jgi:TetR/AcrR family transcriptional regulator, lmrAB and yxaGH operons repressor
MAHPKRSGEDLAGALADVFRAHGYEGASLSRIAEATGLEKASLYYRFPDGKDGMVAAVVRHVNQWFQDQVFLPLERPGKPTQKVRLVARRLREFYGNGSRSCVLDTLSLPAGSSGLREAVRGSLKAWLQAFTDIAREAGASNPEARQRAEQTIIAIEGSLILARALGDKKPFQRVIDRLPELLAGSRSG